MRKLASYFEQHPGHYRALFLLLVLPLLALAGVSLYYQLNRGSAQNFYKASDSRLYVLSDIRTSVLISQRSTGFFPFSGKPFPWIRQGDLVVGIGEKRVHTGRELSEALDQYLDNERMLVLVQRPSRKDYYLRFRVSKDALLEQVYETPVTVYLWHVPVGGASYHAGLRPGDLIYEIDGQTFDRREEADKRFANTLRGQTVTFGVLRGDQTFPIKVTMAQLTIPFSLAGYLLLAFAWLALGLFLGLFRARLPAARLLAIGFLGLGLAMLLYEAPDVGFISRPVVIGCLFLFSALASLIHASYHFPREVPRLMGTRWWRYHEYALVPVATALAVKFHGLGLLLGIVLMVGPQIYLRARFDRRRSRERARMEGLLQLSFLLCLGLVAIWALTRDHLSVALDRSLRSLCAVLVLGAYCGTIAKYRLLGVEIKRSLQYSLIISAWILTLVAFYVVILDQLSHSNLNFLNISLTMQDIEFHDQAATLEERLRRQKVTSMVLAMLAGLVLIKLGVMGRALLRRKFHRTSSDYLQASSQLNRMFESDLGLQGIAEAIATHLRELLLLKACVTVFFREESEVAALSIAAQNLQGQPGTAIRTNAREIARIIKPFRTELSTDFLNHELKSLLCANGLRYIRPIHARNQLLGCIITGEKLSETTYLPRDFNFLAAAADQAATAVENALLYERLSQQELLRQQLALAREIQLASLPQCEPVIAGIDISGASLPALEVGGDYYAYFPEGDERITIVVADVSGKGTSAALYMSKMQGIFASLHDLAISPRELFLKVNPVLYREIKRNTFVTALAARFCVSQCTVDYVRAGHSPLIHYCSMTRKATLLTGKGLALGMENRGMFEKLLEQRSVTWASGDVFLLLSDGLTEMQDSERRLFGEARILELLEREAGGCARDIRDSILEEVQRFGSDNPMHDDQTLVVVKIR